MFPFHNRNASVAQWIEQCPPEACATVRLRSDASEKRRPIGMFDGAPLLPAEK